MSYEQKRKDIQSFFSSNFLILDTEKIAWDNVAFSIPEDNSSWIRFSIQHIDSNYVSLGPNRRTRREGIVFIQVFIPSESNTLLATQIADEIAEIFETKTLSGVVFKSPTIREVGVDKKWFQLNATVPFYYDEITTIN